MSGSPSTSEHRAGFVAHKSVSVHREADPVPDDDLAIHERICGSLVKIVCYKPNVVPRKIKCVVTGVIVASRDTFCLIIALWTAVKSAKSCNWLFEVIFHDGTTMQLAKPIQGVDLKGNMVAFTLQTPTKVNPVQISPQKVSRNEKVFAVGFGLDFETQETLPPRVIISYRSRGFVTHERDGFFNHDCAPRYETCDGHPVFNKQEHFVGITFKNRGISIAYSISSITKLLAKFCDGIKGKPLSEILRCIMDKAEPPREKKEKLKVESRKMKKQRSN